MGFVSRKRGKLVFFPFRGKNADIMHEFYFILFEIIIVVVVLATLVQYVNNVAKDTSFNKRFVSMDLGMLTSVVHYAAGTLVYVYYVPVKFTGSTDILFGDSLVSISETGKDLAPVPFWFLSNRNMDLLKGSASIKAINDTYMPMITFYRTGKKVSLDEKSANALQLVCPTLNTTVTDWPSKKVFVAKVLPKSESSKSNSSTNRIYNRLTAQYHQMSASMSTSAPASQGSAVSAVPADSDLVIAIGDSGEKREPGSLVAYIPIDENIMKERKLACFIINELLTDLTEMFYVQIMPVYVDSLPQESPLRVFKERSDPSQVMVFLDVSKFTADQVDVDNTANAIYNGVKRYYGVETSQISGTTLNFKSTVSVQGLSAPAQAQTTASVPVQPASTPAVDESLGMAEVD